MVSDGQPVNLTSVIVGRGRLGIAGLCAVIAALSTVAVPFVSAVATNVIFAGVVGRLIHGGETSAQAADRLRAQGHPELANLTHTPGVVPGAGIDWDKLWAVLALLAGMYLLAQAATATADLLLNAIGQESVRRLRATVESRLHRLPVGTLESAGRGTVLNSVTVDVGNVANVIAPLFVRLPVSVLTTIGVFAGLFVLSPFFGGVVLLMLPVTVAVIAVIARYSRPAIERQWQTTDELTRTVEDVYGARDTLVAAGARHAADDDIDDITGRLYRSSRTAQALGGSLIPAITTVNALMFVVLAVLGALRVLDGVLTLGALQAVVLLSMQLSSPLNTLSATIPRIQSGLISLRRVRTFLATPQEPGPAVDDPDLAETSTVRSAAAPEIVFDDVHFGYGDDAPVLRGATLRIPAGTTLAIAGVTGSGKTTMVSLLQRFADPTRGRITLDGTDIAALTRSDLRSRLAVVTQEPWLFRGTAQENIAYGGSGDNALLDEILGRLPNGGQTTVSDGSDLLSTGEKQLVTVARALAAQPSILILDEATSAADPHSELLIQRGIAGLRSTTTTIVISHRPSTLAVADQIAVLHDGQIVEQGTFDELDAAGCYFAELQGRTGQGAVVGGEAELEESVVVR